MNRHVYLNTHVQSLSPTSVQLSNSFPEHSVHDRILKFDYAIYALGSNPSAPLNLWASRSDDESVMIAPYGGTKAEGIEWMKRNQERIKKAGSVLVVGGGALGIREFKTSCFISSTLMCVRRICHRYCCNLPLQQISHSSSFEETTSPQI